MAEIATYARPNLLYRYRSLSAENADRELQAIEQKYIYCAHYESMNDPMEGGHRLSSVFSSSKAHIRLKADIGRFMKELGIASFSETKVHEPMWAHYASSFSGICISYSTRKLLSGLPEGVDLVKMNYSDIPPVMLKNSETAPRRAKLALSYKTLRWESEREWRIFVSGKLGPVRYKKMDTVRAIYVGVRTESAIVEKIENCAGKFSIPVFRMNVDKYRMSFNKKV